MSSPSEAELRAQLQNAVAFADNFLTGNTLVADYDTYVESVESDFAQEQVAGATTVRSRAATGLEASPLISPVLTAYAHHIIKTPERAVQAVIDRLDRHFIDTAQTVKSRGFVFGAPVAAGGNTGDGTVNRLTVDEEGLDLENQFDDAKTAKVLSDENSGSDRHEEAFEFRGEAGGRDLLDVRGSGALTRTQFKARTSNQSILQNPGFDQFAITATLTAGLSGPLVAGDEITGWTPDDITNFEVTQVAADQAKDVRGVTNPTAIRFFNNGSLTQAFDRPENRLVINPDVPYYVEVWVKRENSADGTFRITIGSKSQDFVVTTLANGVYNRVRLDLDADLWPINFNINDATVVLTWLSRTTGELVVDEKFFGPMQTFDASWYHISGGLIKFVIDDEFNWADTIASDSKIQKWFWRTFGRYLPHSGTPTLADPP